MAGGLQLAAHTRGRLARAPGADHHAIPHAIVVKVGFLHFWALRGEYLGIFLLQVGDGLQRIHARFLRCQHSNEAAGQRARSLQLAGDSDRRCRSGDDG